MSLKYRLKCVKCNSGDTREQLDGNRICASCGTVFNPLSGEIIEYKTYTNYKDDRKWIRKIEQIIYDSRKYRCAMTVQGVAEKIFYEVVQKYQRSYADGIVMW